MALDADPGAVAVAARPIWLHWTDACSGRALRHTPGYFDRRPIQLKVASAWCGDLWLA
jgi:hypothetical protein